MRAIFEHTQYRSFLRAELSTRITKNPRYSLRAFALALNLSASMLSRVLRGEQNFSDAMACQVGETLGLDATSLEYFTALVQFESAQSMPVKSRLQDRLKQIREDAQVDRAGSGAQSRTDGKLGFQDLSLDVFRCISDWYHVPILEMTHLRAPFQLTPKSAAERLGITEFEAESALERLERLELIEYVEFNERGVKSGRWKKAVANPWFRSQAPNSAIRAFHKVYLEKSLRALEAQAPDERHFGTYAFVIDSKDLKRAQVRLDELAQTFIKEFGQTKSPEEVYALGFQLHRVTKPMSKKERKKK